jgi:transcriptional regulator with XRE-family HTH domain
MDNLGKILGDERKKRNLTLDEVADKTKIRRHIIEAFEDNEFEVLPPIYSKSFLKNYIEFLQISLEDIDSIFDEIFKGKVKKPVPPPKPSDVTDPIKVETRTKKKRTAISESIPDIKKSFNLNIKTSKKDLINIVIYIAIALCLIVLIYFTFKSDDSQDSVTSYQPVEQTTTSSGDTAVIKSEDKGLLSFFEEPDSLILEAVALDTAWMKIEIDGSKIEVLHMAPNVSKRWSAAEFYIVTLGNAGAVKFTRNGTELPPLGPNGSVVRNVKITKTEVVNSSQPWGDSSKKKPRRRKPRRKAIQPLAPSGIEPYKPTNKEKKINQ